MSLTREHIDKLVDRFSNHKEPPQFYINEYRLIILRKSLYIYYFIEKFDRLFDSTVSIYCQTVCHTKFLVSVYFIFNTTFSPIDINGKVAIRKLLEDYLMTA